MFQVMMRIIDWSSMKRTTFHRMFSRQSFMIDAWNQKVTRWNCDVNCCFRRCRFFFFRIRILEYDFDDTASEPLLPGALCLSSLCISSFCFCFVVLTVLRGVNVIFNGTILLKVYWYFSMWVTVVLCKISLEKS